MSEIFESEEGRCHSAKVVIFALIIFNVSLTSVANQIKVYSLREHGDILSYVEHSVPLINVSSDEEGEDAKIGNYIVVCMLFFALSVRIG